MNQNNTVQTSHEKNLQHSPQQTMQHYLKLLACMKLCHKSRTPKFTYKSLTRTLNTHNKQKHQPNEKNLTSLHQTQTLTQLHH
jgi:hypothetical protein